MRLWIVVMLALAGCGAERAATVEWIPSPAGDALCVWAYGDGERVFSRRYPTEDGQRQPPRGSLTFVSGDRVAEEVIVGGRVMRGGAVIAEASERVRFVDGLIEVELPVGRCAPATAGSMDAAIGRFTPAASRMEAFDVDDDGTDELVAWIGAELHVLDAGGPSRAVLTGPTDLRVTGVADFDADCALELIVVDDGAVRLVTAPAGDAALGEPTATGARDAAAGAPTRVVSLVLVDAAGLTVVPRGSGDPLHVDGAFDALAVTDLDGDGVDDVVASGSGGTRLFLGSAGGLDERTEALPPRVAAAAGPLVAADLDGDGLTDLAVADGAAVRIAINRGDGLLEERGGAAPLGLAVSIVALRAGDVDGDCRDEVIAIGADGTALVTRLGGGALVEVAADPPTALDAAVGDFDGDGARELAWLEPEGEVTTWRP